MSTYLIPNCVLLWSSTVVVSRWWPIHLFRQAVVCRHEVPVRLRPAIKLLLGRIPPIRLAHCGDCRMYYWTILTLPSTRRHSYQFPSVDE